MYVRQCAKKVSVLPKKTHKIEQEKSAIEKVNNKTNRKLIQFEQAKRDPF